MNILNVNHLLDPETGGGTAERTFQVSRFLAKAGADCTVLTLDIGSVRQRMTKVPEIRLVAVPCLNRRYFVPRISRKALDRLVAGVDIVNLSGHWTVLNAMVFRSCLRQGKPYVFCPAGALLPFGRSLLLKKLYTRLVGYDLVRAAACCIAVTEEERTGFQGYGVPAERIAVIPNGIDPDDYADPDPAALAAFRQRIGLPDAAYILFLGRLNEIKGPDLLLEAFQQIAARFPGLHLVFAGPDGGMQATLQAAARTPLLAGRVHFTGFLTGEEKTAAIRAASVMAIPSRREAMSIVVLEAGICGTPVLFTDACGLDSLAAAGAGVQVPVAAQAIGAGLATMLSDRAGREAGAVRLQAIVSRQYSWQAQAEQHLRLYQALLGQPARRSAAAV